MVFTIIAESGKARIGRLDTEHGPVETPFFMPIASKGSVKAMSGKSIEDLGFQTPSHLEKYSTGEAAQVFKPARDTRL